MDFLNSKQTTLAKICSQLCGVLFPYLSSLQNGFRASTVGYNQEYSVMQSLLKNFQGNVKVKTQCNTGKWHLATEPAWGTSSYGLVQAIYNLFFLKKIFYSLKFNTIIHCILMLSMHCYQLPDSPTRLILSPLVAINFLQFFR